MTVSELIRQCSICKRTIEEGMAYYKHPKYGIVCEYCPQFSDGGITVEED